ncbi:MAG TPA: energy transducer TonB [Opitutaceae bacterium]|nr:energy transducer TonB [Opitutaceae bacterium]
MDSRLLALFIAAAFAAGCGTTPSVPPQPPVALGEDSTPWGVLPRYEARMRPGSWFNRGGTSAPGTVVADVLVERDGKVREVKIIEVVGSALTARQALATLKDSRYAPLPPDGPELYVVRQIIETKAGPRSAISGGTYGDGPGNSSMPANANPPPVHSR